MKIILQIVIMFFGLSSLLNAQVVYQLESSEMSIIGTSTVHDWESDVTEVNMEGKFVFEGEQLSEIQSLSVSIPVEKIISGRGEIMDNKTYKALKSETNPNILFTLSKVNSMQATAEGLTIEATGILNLGGFEKEINLTVSGVLQEDGLLEFSGTKDLKMTDFEITPPSAMFGAIKTGDAITIKYKVKLSQTSKS